MKRYIGIAAAIVLIVLGLFILTQLLIPVKPTGLGALQVISNVKAKVQLDNKDIGVTPLCKCKAGETISVGSYTVTITPDDASLHPYVVKIKIEPNVLTAVERTFLPGSLASAYVLTLEKTNDKNAQIFLQSLPDGAMVSIDGAAQSVTPFSQSDIAASEHEIEIQKAGFNKKTVKVRTVAGYKLVGQVILGIELGQDSGLPNLSATLTLTPTTTTTPQVTIKNTPTGFLRVRNDPSLSGTEIGRVLPGETYPLVAEQPDWYKIRLKTNEEGWISASYAEKSIL